MAMTPIRTLLYFHTALDRDLAEICDALEGKCELDAPVSDRFAIFHTMASLHTHVEEQGLFPSVEGKVDEKLADYVGEHREEDKLFEATAALLASGEKGGASAATVARELQRHLRAHIEKENGTLIPQIEAALSIEEQQLAVQAVQAQVPKEQMPAMMPWVVRHQPLDDAVTYVGALKANMPPPVFEMAKGWIQAGLPAKRWQDLCERIDGLA